jgi:hypothetical protein
MERPDGGVEVRAGVLDRRALSLLPGPHGTAGPRVEAVEDLVRLDAALRVAHVQRAAVGDGRRGGAAQRQRDDALAEHRLLAQARERVPAQWGERSLELDQHIRAPECGRLGRRDRDDVAHRHARHAHVGMRAQAPRLRQQDVHAIALGHQRHGPAAARPQNARDGEERDGGQAPEGDRILPHSTTDLQTSFSSGRWPRLTTSASGGSPWTNAGS